MRENKSPDVDLEKVRCIHWFKLLRNKRLLIATFTISICTSAMAILEPCVPMWLLGHLNPPPTRWQLGAVFIPDSIGYLIGSHCAGNTDFYLLFDYKYNL